MQTKFKAANLVCKYEFAVLMLLACKELSCKNNLFFFILFERGYAYNCFLIGQYRTGNVY